MASLMRMPSTRPANAAASSTAQTSDRWPRFGLVAALGLMTLAIVIPALTGWRVEMSSFPPLHAGWLPRVGPGTIPALLLAVGGSLYAVQLAEALPWRRLLLVVFGAGLAWMLALASIDGASGVGDVLNGDPSYLTTARGTDDILATFDTYENRIRYGPNVFPVHVAGHPAGALLFFVALVRLGLGSGFEAGMVVTLLGATTAVAVLVTLRVLGAEEGARRAAPLLTLGPAAIWQSVSADGMFAAVAAWGMAALALGAARRSLGWSVFAGLLLGYCVMLSYGLLLLGVLALAVLWAARSWYPLAIAVIAALAVVLAFAVAGFAWWEAYPALHDRYFAGVGGVRPAAYYIWANLAALSFSAGPLLGSGIAMLLTGGRRMLDDARTRVVGLLAGAAVAMALLADLSQMSRGEVERIWLPFVPWLLLSCALLPRRWRRIGIVVQVVAALLVAHLLKPDW